MHIIDGYLEGKSLLDSLRKLPDHLSIKEIAEIFKVSPLTISRLIDEGALETEKDGEESFIKKSVLLDFIDENLTLNLPLLEE